MARPERYTGVDGEGLGTGVSGINKSVYRHPWVMEVWWILWGQVIKVPVRAEDVHGLAPEASQRGATRIFCFPLS